MMRINRLGVFVCLLSILPCALHADIIASREQILGEAQKVADAQLRAIGNKVQIDWTWGVMAAGYSEFSHVTPNGDLYTKELNNLADKVAWTPLLHKAAPFHADDFCITQAFLDLNATHPDPAHLAPIILRMDALADHLKSTKEDTKLTFWWCDALFMAPPAMARMSAVTKDPKYLDAMDGEFWRTTAAFYDQDEHLFYRDAKYVHLKDANGKKIFWSRGNGWVLAGLARVMEYMPKDYPSRPKYESLFKEMSTKLITLQGSDGSWRSSLEDPALFPGSETSGTSLFTFALAWGINNNLLDRNTYLPAVARGWSALMAARQPSDLPGYSQPAGAAPALAKPNSSQVYTTGGYLLAAAEIQRLAPFDLPQVTLVTPIYADEKPATQPAQPAQPAPDAKAFARYVPERMDDIAWKMTASPIASTAQRCSTIRKNTAAAESMSGLNRFASRSLMSGTRATSTM